MTYISNIILVYAININCKEEIKMTDKHEYILNITSGLKFQLNNNKIQFNQFLNSLIMRIIHNVG